MEEAKKILYRLHKTGSITDEELDILLQAVNTNDGMFHPNVTAPYPNKWPYPSTEILYDLLYGKFGPIQ